MEFEIGTGSDSGTECVTIDFHVCDLRLTQRWEHLTDNDFGSRDFLLCHRERYDLFAYRFQPAQAKPSAANIVRSSGPK